MKVRLKRAHAIKEARALTKLDRRIFKSGAFSEDEWKGLKCFWIVMDGKVIGSVAFRHNSEPAKNHDEPYPFIPGSLYIISTGILPEFQGMGIGTFVKAWQVDYAKYHVFSRIVTNARVSNFGSVRLNKKFGFREVCVFKDYYSHPKEDAIVLELKL